eukprot:scaffold1726_cov260-Pinguiococcus_pyrenoidosus.AAC.18
MKTSSEYAHWNRRKLLSRFSPDVRISSSGSGSPAVVRKRPTISSSTSSGAISRFATCCAILFAALAISSRPP